MSRRPLTSAHDRRRGTHSLLACLLLLHLTARAAGQDEAALCSSSNCAAQVANSGDAVEPWAAIYSIQFIRASPSVMPILATFIACALTVVGSVSNLLIDYYHVVKPKKEHEELAAENRHRVTKPATASFLYAALMSVDLVFMKVVIPTMILATAMERMISLSHPVKSFGEARRSLLNSNERLAQAKGDMVKAKGFRQDGVRFLKQFTQDSRKAQQSLTKADEVCGEDRPDVGITGQSAKDLKMAIKKAGKKAGKKADKKAVNKAAKKAAAAADRAKAKQFLGIVKLHVGRAKQHVGHGKKKLEEAMKKFKSAGEFVTKAAVNVDEATRLVRVAEQVVRDAGLEDAANEKAENDFEKADFEKADFEKPDFEKADVEKADFEKADFEKADFEKAENADLGIGNVADGQLSVRRALEELAVRNGDVVSPRAGLQHIVNGARCLAEAARLLGAVAKGLEEPAATTYRKEIESAENVAKDVGEAANNVQRLQKVVEHVGAGGR
eukprot:GHVS01071526.1.p1 GENE.GHVS01071526.1~~GHVS01071526.1.p1  ORF type:complete len:499 (+),score=92.03 GHVS01071526.1:103-1599(+)